ncbi:hypothetical protein WMY93_030792 [Mugilogobius chulae]|uniref:Spermatogenesis-associated protein 13 n=1 Tax=Mugilogobius chulae TaxID=88201 RepID=A0AAW0MQG8_9GOBI
MSRVEQKDRVLSMNEDSFVHTSRTDPVIRSRPLSDLYPFQSSAERNSPYLLSGCGAQVKPVIGGPYTEENGSNGISTSAWSNPLKALPENKPSRIMRLFSNSRKAHSPTADCPNSAYCQDGNSGVQSWSGISGLGVVDSFKKLRSSVLQGIQSRGATNLNEEHVLSSNQETANSGETEKQLKNEGFFVSNGNFLNQKLSQCGSDYEDFDEECDDVNGLTRNSRFSRSIRQAYGAGRISIFDSGKGSTAATVRREAVDSQKTDHIQGVFQKDNFSERSNVKVLGRLSKSAENLHIFKAPFKRKGTSPGPSLLCTDSQRRGKANGTSHIHRTSSVSSVDLTAVDRRGSPVKTKGPVSKLVGSMTDLSMRKRHSPSPSPTSPTPMSPLSRLHDDYSRRLPCVQNTERQRRPSPIRARVLSVQIPPENGINIHHVLISPVSLEPSENTEVFSSGLHCESVIQPSKTDCHHTETNEVPLLKTHEQTNIQDLTVVTSLLNQVTSDQHGRESLFQTEESPSHLAAPLQRRGRQTRLRPVSDYGQLSHKQCIPEELLCERANGLRPDCNGRTVRETGTSTEDCSVDSSLSTDPTTRPVTPSAPYRAVSARFRPSALSQSTPIGLDRVGRRKLHRVLSDGISECSATLDDSVSEEDEEGSFDELPDVTPYLQPGVELSVLNELISSGHAVYAEALWDHVTMEEQELAFKVGDVVRVLDASHSEWWWGRGADKEAWFPSCFVRVRVNQEDSSTESIESVSDHDNPDARDSHSTHHKEQMRTNVVQEIMSTERIYIKHLKDICEGYIRQCRKNPEMFTESQLKTIFSNIEEIYKFQRQFLKDLEKKYNKDQPHLSEIGSCFLLQGEGFSIYSEYCNTHPAACAELQRLMKSGRYKHFFEACRLLQQMIDISIAGFLLTPVQKICKYPLQLGELLKYTPKNHSDYRGVCEAYEAMKNVASLINERKRRLESIDTIAHWQVSILHWEGSDILELSSELIHSGEMTRIIRYGKMQQRSFFLFDHQLVFCKKDVLRRDLLHYRGRLNMDQTEVLDVPDGRDSDLGLTLKNALRLRNAFTLEFMCMLCCRKAQDKQRWLEAFGKERLRVKEDQEMGMEISEEQRKRAIVNARRAKKGKFKSLGYSGSVPPHHQNILPLHQRHVTIPSSVPQQQVFSLAEPPKRKPHQLLYSITRNAFFRK